MATVQELLRGAEGLPSESGRRDAEILLCHCLGRPRTWLYSWPEREVEAAVTAHYRKLLAARAGGVPVAHLTGCREFWSLSLTVDEHTLIPRPETETLVEWALELALPERARVLDLGTGSGAIALALASERVSWQVAAVDVSPEALRVARGNAASLGLERVIFRQSDWFQALGASRFDLLVSNPPYVAAEDPHLARGDLRFEPASALVAGIDGLSDLAALAGGAGRHLVAGGWLLLEHGCDQGAAVRELLQTQGFAQVETRNDLAGLERVTGGCRHAE